MVGDGTSELIPGEPTGPSFFQRYGLSESWRYGSANLLLLLGAASILVGGWAPWLVLAVAMILGSFADEVSGDDRTTLNDGTCLFCKINLYLSLPLVCILALVLVRFAATQPSLTEHSFQLIGVLWLAGYLFALVGATVAHELCHRSSSLAKVSAHVLLGFTGNASFVTYHITPIIGRWAPTTTLPQRGVGKGYARLWRALSCTVHPGSTHRGGPAASPRFGSVVAAQPIDLSSHHSFINCRPRRTLRGPHREHW